MLQRREKVNKTQLLFSLPVVFACVSSSVSCSGTDKRYYTVANHTPGDIRIVFIPDGFQTYYATLYPKYLRSGLLRPLEEFDSRDTIFNAYPTTLSLGVSAIFVRAAPSDRVSVFVFDWPSRPPTGRCHLDISGLECFDVSGNYLEVRPQDAYSPLWRERWRPFWPDL